MTTWWSRLLDFVSPRSCVVCGRRLAVTERTLCPVCTLHLPRTGWYLTPDDNPMARAFWGRIPVERAAALMFYEPQSELAHVIYQLKYSARPDIGEDMGRLMAHELCLSGFFDGIDLIMPVPLTPRRKRQRGYNQSELLARGIGEVTGLPVETHVLRRRHFNTSQTALGHREREENVAGAFTLAGEEALAGRHVLLVDDICTTGATLTACAEALRSVKRIKISVLTLGFTKK